MSAAETKAPDSGGEAAFQTQVALAAPAPGAAETAPPDAGAETAACRIFTLWDYPQGPPPLFSVLNVESWRRHSHLLCDEPVLINDSNVKAFIPDMPDEYFLVDSPAAKSDIIRYALLYHHGGMYMDADFLVVQDLDPVIASLQDNDLVSYTTSDREHSECEDDFSSNFIGGRKGSMFHQRVWEAQKRLLTNHCPIEELWALKVCCFDRPKGQRCHVPWTYIGERVSHPVLGELRSEGGGLKSFCFSGADSFVPDQLGTIFAEHPKLEEARSWWNQHDVPRPLDRIMYHLFNTMFKWRDMSCGQLLNQATLIGKLYNLSFSTGHGATKVPGGSSVAQDFYASHPEFQSIEAVTICYTGPRPDFHARPLEQLFPKVPERRSAWGRRPLRRKAVR